MHTKKLLSFDKDFVWGAATSSYQIEGAFDEDGKGLSIWDDFCHQKGTIEGNETGDTACDSYHYFKEDILHMKEIGIQAYRFSISWPRIFPNGDMVLNPKGLSYYDELVNQLLSVGITPYITLYHWDLPSSLQKTGGWQNKATSYAFADYAEFITKHFCNRVKNFITLNEPQIFIMLGYQSGTHAPGLTLSKKELFFCAHHALLAHGLAVKKMRAVSSDLQIGIASTGKLCYPITYSKKAIETAKQECFSFQTSTSWLFTHTWFLDPIILGKYPENTDCELSGFIKNVSNYDRDIISQPIDFLGINIYNGIPIDETGSPAKKTVGFPRTALKWPITPSVMHYGIAALYERYHLPILITENGLSCNDYLFLDGNIHDVTRIDFLHRYLIELRHAANDGVELLGYFHWSLLDNFEWNNGYNERFGLIYVDYKTKKRTLKDSAFWYQSIIKSNGSIL